MFQVLWEFIIDCSLVFAQKVPPSLSQLILISNLIISAVNRSKIDDVPGYPISQKYLPVNNSSETNKNFNSAPLKPVEHQIENSSKCITVVNYISVGYFSHNNLRRQSTSNGG